MGRKIFADMRSIVVPILMVLFCGEAVAAETTTRDIEYARAGETSLKLDLHRPQQGGAFAPLVIFLGDGPDAPDTSSAAMPLLEHGYAVAIVKYRSPQVAPFPAQIHDIKSAVRFLRSHAGDYGIDPDRIGVWGASAGGHLAALLGTSGGIAELEGESSSISSRVQAVVDYWGPADLLIVEKGSKLRHSIETLLGGALEQKQDLARLASPITHVTSDDPPFLIAHGDADEIVPLRHSEILRSALRRAGIEVTMHMTRGAPHGWNLAPPIQVVVEFFDKHLKQKPATQRTAR